MISYYDLMILLKENKHPRKILVPVDEGRELLYEYNKKYNTYYAVPTSVSESYYEDYSKYLDDNMYEENFFKDNIKVVEPYKFKIGEFVSYFDLLTAIRFNMEPYKVRIHFGEEYHDYIFSSIDYSERKMYIEEYDNGSLPTWESYLSHQVSDGNWFEKNIEIIEAGNSLIKIIEGSDGGSTFSIAAVKIKDINSDTDDDSNIEVWDDVINIEESDFENFLFPLVNKYFDPNMIENLNRVDVDNIFEWYLTNNYITIDSVKNMIEELNNIIDLLINDYNNSSLDFIKKGFDWVLYLDPRIDSRNIRKHGENPEIINYTNEICNFYKRFIYYINKIINEGEKHGYNLISFYGP